MSNAMMWAGSIKKDGAVYAPVGEGKTANIDPADIGAVAVKALTSSGHEGKAYTITGPVALTMQEQLDIIGKRIGKSLKFIDVPPEAAKKSMLEMGMPEGYVNALIELYAVMKANQASLVTNVVEEVTGRKAATFESWVDRHAGIFG